MLLINNIIIFIIIIIIKVGNTRLGDLHHISPKTPAPQYQPIEWKKRNGKQEETKKERAAIPMKRHWPCSWHPTGPHDRIRGH